MTSQYEQITSWSTLLQTNTHTSSASLSHRRTDLSAFLLALSLLKPTFLVHWTSRAHRGLYKQSLVGVLFRSLAVSTWLIFNSDLREPEHTTQRWNKVNRASLVWLAGAWVCSGSSSNVRREARVGRWMPLDIWGKLEGLAVWKAFSRPTQNVLYLLDLSLMGLHYNY